MANDTAVAGSRDDTDRPAVAQPPSRQAGLQRYAALLLTLLVATIGYNALIVAKLPGITPIDGIVYTDAFLKAMDGQVTVAGDTLEAPALDAVACRGVYYYGSGGMTCGPDGRAAPGERRDQFDRLATTAYIHPPTYFFLTSWSVKALQAVLPGDQDPLDLARIVGAVWFSLGALLLIRAAALWGARPWIAAAVVLAFVPTPTFLAMFNFVTPDAMGLLVSAAVVLGVTMWWQRRMPAWPLLAFGLLTSAVKQTYFLAAVAGVVVVAALWLFTRRRALQETALALGCLLAGTALGAFGWEKIKQLIAGPISPAAGGGARNGPLQTPQSLEGLLSLVFAPFRVIPMEAASTSIPLPPGVFLAASALALATLAAAGGAVIYRRSRNPIFALGAGGLTIMALASVVVSGIMYVRGGWLLPVAPRYAFAAWPFYVLPLLIVVRRRWLVVLTLLLLAAGLACWLVWPSHPPFPAAG